MPGRLPIGIGVIVTGFGGGVAGLAGDPVAVGEVVAVGEFAGVGADVMATVADAEGSCSSPSALAVAVRQTEVTVVAVTGTVT